MDQKLHPQTRVTTAPPPVRRGSTSEPTSSKTRDAANASPAVSGAATKDSAGMALAATSGAPLPSHLQDAQLVQTKRAALQEANTNRRVVMMTSIIECCSFDRDSVRAVHTWLKEEVHKLWAA
ncbi:hypothetical protein PINS_up006446 [Pythium insidiosum]|nr:hypothetical protein PINS_up006446 [Pythium insidiosum]